MAKMHAAHGGGLSQSPNPVLCFCGCSSCSPHFSCFFSVPDLHKAFKLSTTISLTNMHALEHTSGRVVRYESPLEILEDFYHLRLNFYEKRKVTNTSVFLCPSISYLSLSLSMCVCSPC